MGKVYTGYFAQIKKHKAAGCKVISIARFSPKWFDGEECKTLAPSADLLNRYRSGITDSNAYDEEYIQYLTGIDVLNVVEGLRSEEDVILCCYEKPSDFCHRHVLARYCEQLGINITEYPV